MGGMRLQMLVLLPSSDRICRIGKLSMKNRFYCRRLNPHCRKHCNCLASSQFPKLTFTGISHLKVFDGPRAGIPKHWVHSIDTTTSFTVTPVETRWLTPLTNLEVAQWQLSDLIWMRNQAQYLAATIDVAVVLRQLIWLNWFWGRPYVQVLRSLRP